MAEDFWIDNVGQNMLKGVDGDVTNPLRLSDHYINQFLLHIPSARASYNRLYPSLLPEEQARLDRLTETAASEMILDDVVAADRLQNVMNTAGVQRGGRWKPPPYKAP